MKSPTYYQVTELGTRFGVIKLIIISLFISSVSFTISVTSIFEWLRRLVSTIHPKLEELIHCPYCLSHWILFLFLAINYGKFEPVNILKEEYIMNFTVSIFAIICISAIVHYVLLRAYEPVLRMMLLKKMEKLND